MQIDETAATANNSTTDALGEALLAMGLARSQRLGAVEWIGAFEGRDLRLGISRQSRTRCAGEVRYRQHLGFRLRIEIQTGIPLRLYLVPAGFADSGLVRWLYRRRGMQVIDKMPEALAGFRVVTRDAAWGEQLLARSELIDAIAGLLNERTQSGIKGSVYFEPEWLHYGSGILQRDDFDQVWVISILERLTRIARVADRLPPPQHPEKPSRFAAFARRKPLQAALLLLAGFLAILILFGMGLMAMTVLIAIWLA